MRRLSTRVVGRWLRPAANQLESDSMRKQPFSAADPPPASYGEDQVSKESIVATVLASLGSRESELKFQWENPQGTRTRHFVVDDFLPGDISTNAYNGFPKDGQGFYSRDSFREKKQQSELLSDYDPLLAEITYALQDPRVVGVMGRITGIDALEPDPNLSRGGLSMMFKGDYLNPHLDNSHDAKRDRYRRLNILYYVSPEWKLENGGNFELWNEERDVPKVIVSSQNRLVVMETTRHSLHSVNEVKVDLPRCCISNYYYSEESPDGDNYYHVTSFDGRPGQIVKKGLTKLDNALRGAISKFTGKSRG